MITEYFCKKLNQQILLEVNDATKRYHMIDDGGVETEVGELLYGLVKAIKPNNIIETGTYSGISASYLAQGLKDNGFGHLQSLEIEQTHIQRAIERLKKLGLMDWVTILNQSSTAFTPDRQYELMFLDSEPWLRFHELVRYFPNLKEGGFALLHDLHHHMGQVAVEGKEFAWPWGKLPEELKKLVNSGQLRVCSFPNPRGLSMFYKPTLSDYRWEEK